MSLGREVIYGRVFAFFSALTVGGSPAFKTATRKLDTWDGVEAEDCPALLISQRTETAEFRKGLPLKWRLNLDLYLYVRTNAQNDPSIIPSQVLNPLLDAIEDALKRDDIANDACTLGGLVSHCSYSGSITITEGTLGDEAVALVPISILVPATS